MCLTVDLKKTQRLQNSSKTEFVFYKVLNKECRHFGQGCRLYSVYQNRRWQPGINQSDISAAKLKQYKHDIENIYGALINIFNGIHVYTTLAQAKAKATAHKVIVKVICRKDDLIAVGNRGDAVFTQVWLSKAEYIEKLHS